MGEYYVDWNRGSDSNSGASASFPWKSLSKIKALSAGALPAGSVIHLADDSIWDIQETLSANNYLFLTNLVNGAAGNPITITGYGNYGSKPHVKYTMVPQSGWWAWDAVVGAWYLELAATIWARGGIGVIIGGVYAASCWYDSQLGPASAINSVVGTNGVTADTLRWIAPTGGYRLYVAGAGIDAGTDPTTAYGYGNVIIYPAAVFHGWNSFANTEIDGLEFTGGGVYLTYGAGTLNLPGFHIKNCKSSGIGALIYTVANNPNPDSLIEINIHDNDISNVTRTCINMDGVGTGESYNNRFSYGNLCQSTGGFYHMQLSRSTGGYAPYRVRDNYAEYAVNGVGERGFDGCCYYADAGDDGTEFLRNVAAHSYKGFQLNSGNASLLASNIAYDCCKFGTFTDAEAVNNSNYVLVNNLWVSSLTPNDYAHGDDESPTSVFGAWCNTGGSIAGAKFQNNMLVVRGSGWENSTAFTLYQPGLWSGSGVSGMQVDTNAVIGGQISRLISATGVYADKTGIYPGTVQAGGAGVSYRDSLPAGLASVECLNKGTDTGIVGMVDYLGNSFQARPSIGAFEPVSLARCI